MIQENKYYFSFVKTKTTIQYDFNPEFFLINGLFIHNVFCFKPLLWQELHKKSSNEFWISTRINIYENPQVYLFC